MKASELANFVRYEDGRLYWLATKKEAGWCVHGAWIVRIGKREFPRSRLVWALVNGEWPLSRVLHCNGVRTDDRIQNLKLVTVRDGKKSGVLTAERLRQLLSYDPATGLFTWKQNKPGKRIGEAAGCDKGGGYMSISVDGTQYNAHRLAWLYVTGDWPAQFVDHKDGNPSNNSFGNLRLANRSQNNHNSRRRAHNSSGIKGVYRKKNRWAVSITVNRKKIWVGSFIDLEDAAKARENAAIKYHGEFARHE